MTLLTIDDLRLDVGQKNLLAGMSLTVEQGETVALVGESGSGKSITARAVLGLLPETAHTTGRVLLDGIDMIDASSQTQRRQRRTVASMIFQDPRSGINPVRRVGDFLTEALEQCHGWSPDRARERALELLRTVGLPDPVRHLKQYPHEFSGGMLQRIMIAAALSTEPRLLLCDEPTTALDVTTQAEIIQLLAAQRDERQMGMLFITHDLNLAASISDRVYVMRAGVVVEHGEVRTVFATPQHEYTRQLIAATPSMAGPGVSPHPKTGPVLTVSGLTKTYRTRYGDVPAVRDVSFELERGTSLGIVGESGSGKSTIARMLVALEAPDSGKIVVDGNHLAQGARLSRQQRLARARTTQIVFQDPYQSLDPRIPVGRAVADVLALHFGIAGDEARKRVEELLGQVGLTPEHSQSLPRRLSGGQRQRAAIAKALAVSPTILVLDEATSALDVSVQAQVLELLEKIKNENGQSMVLVSHNLAVVRQVCDEAFVLREGQIVERGRPVDLLMHPQHPYTRLLVSAIPVPAVSK